ncbi:MAG: ACS family hexuronate transporter-like MFS transporter, partial [Sphingomonas echinoides]
MMATADLPIDTGASGTKTADASAVGRYRWVICGLLFAATAINYVDRQMIGLLKPNISGEFGWDENAYA